MSMIGHSKQIKNHFSEIFQKIIFLAKWAVFSQLWLKVMQAYIFGSTSGIIFKLCSMVAFNMQRKIFSVQFPKNYLLGQIGNFILTASQKDLSLYLRICSEDFFRLCSMIGHNKERKMNQMEFPKKILFWAKWAILA